MPDLGQHFPISNLGTSVRQDIAAASPLVRKPARSDASGQSKGYDSSFAASQSGVKPHPSPQSRSRRDLTDLSPAELGPPPTFEASPLEYEAQLANLLKRLAEQHDRSGADAATPDAQSVIGHTDETDPNADRQITSAPEGLDDRSESPTESLPGSDGFPETA